MNNLSKNCECCGGGYCSGKSYGDAWNQHGVYKDGVKVPASGLCEFCNRKEGNVWYTPKMKCHAER